MLLLKNKEGDNTVMSWKIERIPLGIFNLKKKYKNKEYWIEFHAADLGHLWIEKMPYS